MNSTSLVRKLEKQLYDKETFKNAERLERIFIYLTSGKEISHYQITSKEKEYLEWLEKAYSLYFKYRSKKKTCKVLAQMIPAGFKHIQAGKVLQDAENLFSQFERVDKTIQRGIVRESIYAAIRRTEKALKKHGNGEYAAQNTAALEKVIQGYWDKLIKLDQLDKESTGERIDTSIPEIHFTDDDKVLTETADAEILN